MHVPHAMHIQLLCYIIRCKYVDCNLYCVVTEYFLCDCLKGQATEVHNVSIHLQGERSFWSRQKPINANTTVQFCSRLIRTGAAPLEGWTATPLRMQTELNSVLDTSRGFVSADQTRLNPEIHRGQFLYFYLWRLKIFLLPLMQSPFIVSAMFLYCK